MNDQMGFSTGLAAVAASGSIRSKKRRDFGRRLIVEGGEAASIGKRWIEASKLHDEGIRLNGWFVGKTQRLKAKKLISEGFDKMKECEAAYASSKLSTE